MLGLFKVVWIVIGCQSFIVHQMEKKLFLKVIPPVYHYHFSSDVDFLILKELE